MADPFTIIGGVGSIFQIIHSVTKVAKSIQEVRESYKNVALNMTLVASQLSTIRAALEALHAWRTSDNVKTEATLQLDKDLGLSLSCCAILITVIDGKLTESGYKPGMGAKQKINYIWLEDILKDYVSNLEGQVRALQLLLTIFQCRTATEQKQQLANMESRGIIEQVRAETMSLSIGESEMDDAMSIISQDPSIHLDVDSILMRSPAYMRVYGGERQEPLRRKKVSGKPPPPPPRRKTGPRPNPEPQVSYQTASSTTETVSQLPPGSAPTLPSQAPSKPPQKPLPPPPPQEQTYLSPEQQSTPLPPSSKLEVSPQRTIPQDSIPPSEIAPQPPPIPPRPKARMRSLDQTSRTESQEEVRNDRRVAEGDTVSPGHRTTAQEPEAKVEFQSSPESGLVAKRSPSQVAGPEEGSPYIEAAGPEQYPLPHTSTNSSTEEPAEMPDVGKELSSVTIEPIEELRGQTQNTEPSTIDNGPVDPGKETSIGPSSDVAAADLKNKGKSTEPTSPLDGFRDQLAMAFEEKSPSTATEEGLGLSFASRELKSTAAIPEEENVMSYKAEPSFNYEWRFPTSDTRTEARQEGPQKTLSIHSSVDLYDASVKDLPIKADSRSPSLHPVANQEPNASIMTEDVDDEMEARIEGLSVLDHQLVSTKSDPLHQDEIDPAAPRTESEYSIDQSNTNKPVETPSERSEMFTTPPSSTVLSPQITMTPSEDIDEGEASHNFQPHVTNSMSSSPTRPPPPPPTSIVPMPPMPVLSYNTSPSSSQPMRYSGLETATISSGRDSSVFDASSTISSSERSVDNTTITTHQSTANTAATSVSIDGQSLAREQAQSNLRRLQNELAAAKARGDSKSAQNSLQESIEVIRNTYLASAPVESKKSRSPKLSSRASIIRFPSMPSSAKASALGDAAAAGDFEKVKSLLEARVSCDARSDSLKTPLMRAALNGHIRCLDILQLRGADEFAVDAKGRNVLHLAVASNQVSSVRWLLNAYPPTRPETLKHRGSILFKATDSIISRPTKNLRETSDAEGSKPLHVAVEINQGGMIKTLLAAGVAIEARNNWGRTALLQAIISARHEAFDTLFSNGANINAVDARGMSPLHWAAKTGQDGLVSMLLGKGADRYAWDSEGNQPMHQAAWVGQVSAIEILLHEPNELKNKTRQGETLLHLACLNKNQVLASYLIEKDVDINAEATPQPSLLNSLAGFKFLGPGMTPLHYACCKGDFEMAVLLLEHNALANTPTADGATALMMAAECENTNIVNLLISRGAKVNASMPGSLTTALHIAARHGDLETIQQLCRAKANDAARNDGGSYGRTPLEEATKFCTDKQKRTAVEDYFRVLRMNKIKHSRAQTQSNAPSGNYGGESSLETRSLVPQMQQPGMQGQQPWIYPPPQQQQWYANTYPQLLPQQAQFMQMQMQMQMQQQQQQQWYDANPLTHVESPPPYQAGPGAPGRLANRAPVYRPGDGNGNGST